MVDPRWRPFAFHVVGQNAPEPVFGWDVSSEVRVVGEEVVSVGSEDLVFQLPGVNDVVVAPGFIYEVVGFVELALRKNRVRSRPPSVSSRTMSLKAWRPLSGS